MSGVNPLLLPAFPYLEYLERMTQRRVDGLSCSMKPCSMDTSPSSFPLAYVAATATTKAPCDQLCTLFQSLTPGGAYAK